MDISIIKKKNLSFIEFARKNSLYIIEMTIVLVYLLFSLFSIYLQPINLILGVFCVLILPGYNFLEMLKPNLKTYEKLGYTTITSLMLGNIVMFLLYIFTFSFYANPTGDNFSFFFNGQLLVVLIQILNILFILITLKKRLKSERLGDTHNNEDFKSLGVSFREIFNSLGKVMKTHRFLVFCIFVISLVFMGISAFYSVNTGNSYGVNYLDYKDNFTFFYRVPPIFYLFLVSSILSLIYIIFYCQNKYFILISISAFLYALWILPYIQIGNYFSKDSYLLRNILINYFDGGILANSNYNFLTNGLGFYGAFRYTTSVFTGILFMSATGVNIDIALWYLFPLIYITIPFFFYSVFKRFSDKSDKNIHVLVFLVIVTIFTPQFIKTPHSAVTGTIGTWIFLILSIELFFLLSGDSSLRKKKKELIFISLLYFFLCLTHFEETVYILILILTSTIYFAIFKFRDLGLNINSKNVEKRKELKAFLLLSLTIISIFTLSFYFTLEFFKFVGSLFGTVTGQMDFLDIFYKFYLGTLIPLNPLLAGGLQLNFILIVIILVSLFLFYLFLYLSLFKFFNFYKRVFNIVKNNVRKIIQFIHKPIFYKFLLPIIYVISFVSIFIIDTFFYSFIDEIGFLFLIEFMLSYSLLIFNIYFFIQGVFYYQSKNHKQNYFLLAIIASSSVMIGLFIAGNYTLFFYILNSRFFSFLAFFNLIIIQNTFYKDFYRKKEKKTIMLLLLILFLLAFFYSLRKLAWG